VTGVNAAAKAAVSTSDVRIPLQFLVSRVTVLDSATLSDDAAAAVAEVSQFANGSLRIKLHDKPAALEKLGRTFGMFKDRIEHIGKVGEPLKMRSDLEIGRRLAFVLELIARGEVKAKIPDQAEWSPHTQQAHAGTLLPHTKHGCARGCHWKRMARRQARRRA